VLADGEPGELVFTSLTKEALPIIRYRTRDLTALLPPSSRAMRRMSKITGRSDDMLIIRGVNMFPTQIEELILKMPRLAPIYQIVLTRDGHLDQVEVIAEMRADAGPVSAAEHAALCRELQQCIKAHVGISTQVSILGADQIERSLVGKAKRVIDKRPKMAPAVLAGAR
jgi:phenylacetate-CoA ligase